MQAACRVPVTRARRSADACRSKRTISGDKRARTVPPGCRDEQGIERVQPVVALIQVERWNDNAVRRCQERAEQRGEPACVSACFAPRPASSVDVRELLNHVRRGRRVDRPGCHRIEEALARVPVRMIGPDRVEQDVRVDDDHGRRPRASWISALSSSTVCGRATGFPTRTPSAAEPLRSDGDSDFREPRV